MPGAGDGVAVGFRFRDDGERRFARIALRVGGQELRLARALGRREAAQFGVQIVLPLRDQGQRVIIGGRAGARPPRRAWLNRASPKNVQSRLGSQPNDVLSAAAAVRTTVLGFENGRMKWPRSRPRR